MRYLIVMFFLLVATSCTRTKVVGETAHIKIEELGLSFLSRIDTGASNTSIHAVELKVIDGDDNPKKNKGKKISFTTETVKGEKKTITAVIDDVALVTNSQGQEYRYEVKMTLNWKEVSKKVTVNLRDRSKMTYKLLIGRSWLADDILVDVSKKATE